MNYGYHPRFKITEKDIEKATLPTLIRNDIKAYVAKMRVIEEYCRLKMKYAQTVHAQYADAKRLPPPVYNAGDKVWLMRRFIHTPRLSSKLDFKNLGKYEVLERLATHAYKLKLPPTMKVHPVFHISLLEPASNGTTACNASARHCRERY